jgi:hypothetical protein
VLAIAAGALWLAPGALGAGWCGTGETGADRPSTVNGAQIHALYALPSDGVDRFAEIAKGLADDVAAIDAWWRTQDPTRTPRFDYADFGNGCTAVDISFVQIPSTGAELANGLAGVERIVRLLTNAGFASRADRYLVYYDGPVFQDGVCGATTGGPFLSGPSWAIVWLPACPDVETAFVAAHELAHALGAVPRGAPHVCSFSPGHACDSTQDLMYPVASDVPLAQAVLDVNHDDYYAHTGTWPDVQDSAWLRHLDSAQQHLSIGFSGAGSVTSDVPGVACTTTCETVWDGGSLVGLTANGVTGQSRFIGWRGSCKGRLMCVLTLDEARAVTAVFGPVTINVRVTTNGRGGVTCTPRCTTTMRAGTALTLRAKAARGWRFVGWTGACRGRGAVCRPSTDFALATQARFRRAA